MPFQKRTRCHPFRPPCSHGPISVRWSLNPSTAHATRNLQTGVDQDTSTPVQQYHVCPLERDPERSPSAREASPLKYQTLPPLGERKQDQTTVLVTHKTLTSRIRRIVERHSH